MKACRFLGEVLLVFIGCVQASATPILAEFVRAELPPNSTTTPLPFLLSGANDTLFLKFKIPNFSNIASINYLEVDLLLYDDDDGGGESGRFQFALPGGNLDLGGFAANIRPLTALNPGVVPLTVCSCEIDQILPSLQDGNFRIKIMRDTGDFFVDHQQGMAFLDVTLVPEPSAFIGCVTGLLLIGALRRTNCLRR